jgi:hypothetical protein
VLRIFRHYVPGLALLIFAGDQAIVALSFLAAGAGGWWWWPKVRNALRFERTGRWVEIYEGLKNDAERE